MTTFSAYLSKPHTRATLAKKPGDPGFSLIELVVVVAVLAVLAAIAIPAFTNISNEAAHAAAKNSLATMVKECAVKIAKDGSGSHGSVSGSDGVYYTVGAANTCGSAVTNQVAVACANKGTAASYAANLTTGAKIAAAGAVTAPTTPAGATACPASASAW